MRKSLLNVGKALCAQVVNGARRDYTYDKTWTRLRRSVYVAIYVCTAHAAEFSVCLKFQIKQRRPEGGGFNPPEIPKFW